jgi:hypothetical protein
LLAVVFTIHLFLNSWELMTRHSLRAIYA